MGTTFVSLSVESDAPGFWMRDGVLELWLRLLALHIDEPTPDDPDADYVYAIRNQWLLASKGYFTGHVPHDLETITDSDVGRRVVKQAIDSVRKSITSSKEDLRGSTLDLLGFDSTGYSTIERSRILDIADGFDALLTGQITGDAKSTGYMPGSKIG